MRDERLAAELAEAHAQAEQQEHLRSELESVRAKLESLTGERIEEQRVLSGDLANTHAKLEALERAIEDEHQRTDEARALVAELRQELGDLRSAGGGGRRRRPDGRAALARCNRGRRAAHGPRRAGRRCSAHPFHPRVRRLG